MWKNNIMNQDVSRWTAVKFNLGLVWPMETVSLSYCHIYVFYIFITLSKAINFKVWNLAAGDSFVHWCVVWDNFYGGFLIAIHFVLKYKKKCIISYDTYEKCIKSHKISDIQKCIISYICVYFLFHSYVANYEQR